jgi:N-acetylglucosamine-6-phosphate deacetylase
MNVTVREGRCEHEGKLAGSVLTLDRAVRNIIRHAGVSLQTAIQFATLNPARRLEIEADRGVLAPGRSADLVALNSNGEIAFAMAAGHVS